MSKAQPVALVGSGPSKEGTEKREELMLTGQSPCATLLSNLTAPSHLVTQQSRELSAYVPIFQMRKPEFALSSNDLPMVVQLTAGRGRS